MWWYLAALSLLVGLTLIYLRKWGWLTCFVLLMAVWWFIWGALNTVTVIRGH